MKRTLCILSTAIFLGGVLSSCESITSESEYYKFDTTITLEAKPIKINEVLKPVNLILLSDYLVVVNTPSGDLPIFNIYAKNDMKFLYGFGKHGMGPLDYIAFATPQHISSNILPVYNSITNTLICYEIADDKETVISSRKVEKTTPGLMQQMALINDSILLYNVRGYLGVGTYSFNLNANSIIDSLDLVTPYRSIHGTKFEDYYFDYGNNIVVASFEYIDEIAKVELTADYRFSPSTANLSHPGGELDEKKNSNITHYSYPYIGEKYIFVERVGRPMKDMNPLNPGRNFRFDIYVFDMELQPLYRLKFNQNIIRFVVDEDAGVLYSWDTTSDFDYIHKYTLPDTSSGVVL